MNQSNNFTPYFNAKYHNLFVCVMSRQYIRILSYSCIVTIRINSQYIILRFMVCVCVCELRHV